MRRVKILQPSNRTSARMWPLKTRPRHSLHLGFLAVLHRVAESPDRAGMVELQMRYPFSVYLIVSEWTLWAMFDNCQFGIRNGSLKGGGVHTIFEE